VSTETETRQALEALRNAAKEKVSAMMFEAVKKFAKANAGAFPADVTQLKPYFETSIDDSILARYEVLPASNVTNLGLARRGAESLIAEKAPVDIDYDARFVIGPAGYGKSDFDADALIPVVRAFQTANNGNAPGDPSQLLPYVRTPGQSRALRKWIERFPTLPK
jgi:hypothetical protein